ncbi:MAG: TonB-dependent receptor, partial [Candidatus Neomarinimicrobiota bacterium]
DLLRRKWIKNNYYGIIPTLTWDKDIIRFDLGAEIRFYKGDHFGEVSDFSDPALISELGEGWYRYYHYVGRKNTITGFAHLAWSPDNAPFVIMADIQTQNHYWNLKQDIIVHGEGHKLKADWNFLNPRLGMVVHMGDSLFWFINYGKAQKEPADNQIINADDFWSEPILAAAEVINDWEMGINITFGKGHGSINYYRINYLNEQLKNIDVKQEGEYEYYAADSTVHQGVEWEFSHVFNSRLGLDANGTLLMNNYTNGNSLPNIPASLFNLTLNYSFHPNLQLNAHLKTIGQIYIDDLNREEAMIKPYSLMDLGARLHWKDLELSLKINNIFNRLYSTYGYGYEADGFQSFYWPGATRNAYLSIMYKL